MSHLPKEEEKETDSTKFIPPTDEPKIMALIGEPHSGKSVLLKSIMHYYAKRKYFKYGIVITGSKFNGDYDGWLPESAVWDGYDEERLKQYLKVLEDRATQLKKTGQKLPNSFIILDDLCGQLSKSDWFTTFITRFRHYGITLMIASQYPSDAKSFCTMLRSFTDIAFMFPNLQSHYIKGFYLAWGGYFDNIEEMKNTLAQVKQTRYASLLFRKQFSSKETAYLQYLAKPVTEDFRMVF